MPKYTEAKKKNNRKWDAGNLDRVSLALHKGDKERIQAAAALAGESMNAYIITAVNRRINSEISQEEENNN